MLLAVTFTIELVTIWEGLKKKKQKVVKIKVTLPKIPAITDGAWAPKVLLSFFLICFPVIYSIASGLRHVCLALAQPFHLPTEIQSKKKKALWPRAELALSISSKGKQTERCTDLRSVGFGANPNSFCTDGSPIAYTYHPNSVKDGRVCVNVYINRT